MELTTRGYDGNILHASAVHKVYHSFIDKVEWRFKGTNSLGSGPALKKEAPREGVLDYEGC